jgi:uncharacterized membrane protein YccC
VGVAAYWLLGMQNHGFWIPLTILFVLRPEDNETFRRLALRAITTYAVLLADNLGEPTLEAARQRAAATVLGIAIAGLAFLLWPNPGERKVRALA